MNADTISCPYCNTQFPAPAAAAGPRLNCPRCGESFPYHSSRALQTEPGSAAALSLAPPVAERWSNRRLAFTVLATMTGMALVGLTFALLTVKTRRDHDPKPPPPPPPPLLGYLPPGSNVVLSINVTAALRTPAGRAFLDHAEIGNFGFHFDAVEKAIGLNRDNLEQVVIGVKVDDGHIVVLARTRRPYNVKQVRDALKANESVKVGKKEAFHFEAPGLPWTPVLWPADDWTVIVASSTNGLKAVPDAPDAAANGMTTTLQDMRKERIPAGAQVWLVATIDNLEPVRFFLEKRMTGETLDALLAVRSLAIGLRLDETVKLDAAFGTFNPGRTPPAPSRDEASAEALLKLLNQSKNTTFLKVLGPQAGGEKVAAELAKSLTSKREGTWVLLEASANAETVREAVKP